jgi:hypothetical protein
MDRRAERINSTQIPADLRRLVDFLDTRIQGPMGFRFGWDGIIGLIPGLGDIVTGAMSFYVIFRSAALGAPASLLLRMGANVLFENFIDLIPIFGNLFDFFWKSNTKNLRLLESYLHNPRKVTVSSRIWIAVALLMILGVVVGIISLGIFILGKLWMWLSQTGQPAWL